MKSIIIILGLLSGSCSTTKQTEHSNHIIIGRWCSKLTMADYPHLTFREDGYVTFDSKIDTIFGLKYRIHKNYLEFASEKKRIVKSKILEITKDSLVLESLLDHQTQQVYYRCK